MPHSSKMLYLTICHIHRLIGPQQTQNISITFIQCWTNVKDVGPTLYKCYTNVQFQITDCNPETANVGEFQTRQGVFIQLYTCATHSDKIDPKVYFAVF